MEEVQGWSQLVFLGTMVAGMTLLAAAQLRALTRRDHPRDRRRKGDYALDALVLYLLAAASYVVGGGLLQLWQPEAGLILGQVLFLAAPAFLMARALRMDPRRLLSLERGDRRQLGWGLLLGLATWLPVGLYVELQSYVVPLPEGYEEAFAAQVIPDSPAALVLALVAFALTPGICEELLFRGAILGLLRTGLRDRWAVLISAALFGLLHADPFRVAPTALLGLLLGAVVVRTGSLWPAIALHIAHNATLLSLGMAMDGAEGEAPTWLSTLGVVALAAGAWGVFSRGVDEGPGGGSR